MGNIAPRAGFEPTPLALWTSELTNKIARLSDVIA